MNTDNHDLIHWRLRQGCGKANPELLRITRLGRRQLFPDFVFVIGSEEIERGDFSRLRHAFKLQSSPAKFRHLIGRVTFVVAGYETCSEELFEIWAVRSYFAQLNCHWPFWAAFCNLRSGTLKIFASSVIDDLNAMRQTDQRYSDVHIRRGDVTKFFANAIPFTMAVHKVAGFSAGKGRKRLTAVAGHLGLL